MSALLVALGIVFAVAGCKTQQLSGGGAQVATSQSAPADSGWKPGNCTSLGYLVGRGGGAFGGGWISNEKLIDYAMNDLRNKAAKLGANFVQHDSPTLGVTGAGGDTNTTTATVSGTAYRCHHDPPASTVASAPVAGPSATVCVPGSTQGCVGPGGCTGGQYCVDNGSKYSPCDCGGAVTPPAPAAAQAAPAAQ